MLSFVTIYILLVLIDADRDVEEIFADVRTILDPLFTGLNEWAAQFDGSI